MEGVGCVWCRCRCRCRRPQPTARPTGAPHTCSLPSPPQPPRSVTIKFDHIEGMETVYCQVQGKDRGVVEAAGAALGLEGTYIPHSYIELVQIGHLTEVGGAGGWGGRGGFLVGGEWCRAGSGAEHALVGPALTAPAALLPLPPSPVPPRSRSRR